MNKYTVRGIAGGLAISALFLLGFERLAPAQQHTAEEDSTSARLVQMKKELEAAKTREQQLEKKYEAKIRTLADKPSGKPEIRCYLTISKGVTSIDISKRLEKAGVISSAKEFNNYLTRNKWEHIIQTGDYLLSNRMSMEEIAKAITRQS